MSERYTDLMQERLDGNLDAQQDAELREYLDTEPEAAEKAAALETVHDMLLRSPIMRAPDRLAATIMARLAQAVAEQAELQDMPLALQQALLLSSSMVILNMMPVMVASSYMVINAMAQPRLLTDTIARTVSMMVMMIDAMSIVVEEMENLVREDPRSAPIAASLLPTVMMGMLEAMQADVAESLMPNGTTPGEDAPPQT